MAGLEPADEGVKVPCLTTWLHPCVGERLGPEQKLRPFRLNVGWVKGFEPSTPGTTIRCSNQLSYTHHITDVRLRLKLAGTPGGTRTPGPLLRRQLLYPPELQARIIVPASRPRREPQRNEQAFWNEDFGAGDGNRTHATSLEGWDSTIELHPHGRYFPLTSAFKYYHIFKRLSMAFCKFFIQKRRDVPRAAWTAPSLGTFFIKRSNRPYYNGSANWNPSPSISV